MTPDPDGRGRSAGIDVSVALNGDPHPEVGVARKIGERPRPRVLLVGEEELPAGVADELRQLAPTVESVDDLEGVRQAEWDLVVTAASPLRAVGASWSLNLDLFTRALLFVAPDGDTDVDTLDAGLTRDSSGFPQIWTVTARWRDRCSVFPICETDDGEWNRLVAESLLPAVQARSDYWTLGGRLVTWTPIAVDDDGHALAAIYRPPQPMVPRADATPMEVVVLPTDLRDPVRWVRWLLRRWRRFDPASFALLRDWDTDSRWLTPEERRIRAEIDGLIAERARLLGDLDQRQADLAAESAAASERAAKGPRRLLTAGNDDLVDAVAAVLEQVGFAVRRPDTDPARKGDLLEDLQLLDFDDSTWEALVEVRAYKGGAAVNDLLRLNRFASRFASQQGRRPRALWYVVNQHRDHPPDIRPDPLHANPDELTTFSEDGGLVVDTAELFLLLQRLPHEPTALAEIRRRLRTATGVVTAQALLD